MTDLKTKLAQHKLNIPCSNCGGKIPVTIGRVKEENHLICGSCGAGTMVEQVEQLEQDIIRTMEQNATKIRALMAKFGK